MTKTCADCLRIGLSRFVLMGLAASFSFLAARQADAAEYKIGGFDIFIDTTVSGGVQVRADAREPGLVSAFNGGPQECYGDADPNGGPCDGALTVIGLETGRIEINDGLPFNFAGGANGDDGRLNFDQGDLTSGVFKMTNDIEASRSGWTFFARINSFYDAILNTDSSYERIGISTDAAEEQVGFDVEVLDAYLTTDFDIGNSPLNVRFGKQVINWGESTFFLNGNNAFSPIDVSAFRRPGAEVREALLPELAASFSLGLPYELTLEGYYLLAWNPYELDPSGTPFSGSDIATPGIEYGDRLYLSSSSRTGSWRRNCTGSPSRRAAEATSDLLEAGGADAGSVDLPDLPTGECADAYNATTEAYNTYAAAVAAAPALLEVDEIEPLADDATEAERDAHEEAVRNRDLQIVPSAVARATAIGTAAAPFNAVVQAQVDRLRGLGDQGLYDYRVNLPIGLGEFYAQRGPDGIRGLGLDGIQGTDDDTTAVYDNDLNYLPRLPDISADDEGQFGAAVRWYAEDLNGTEFGFYYQNIHSRVPIAEVFYYEKPVVTLATTGFTSGLGAALNGVGCSAGAFLVSQGAPASLAALGYLDTGAFLDPQIPLYQDTTARTAAELPQAVQDASAALGPDVRRVTNADIWRLPLNPEHFRIAADQTMGTTDTGDDVERAGLGDLLKYGAFADAVLGQVSVRNSWTTPHGETEIQESLRTNGPNRYDIARINCALSVSQTAGANGLRTTSLAGAAEARQGAPASVADAIFDGTRDGISGLGLVALNGSEYLTTQHRNAIQLIYPEDIEILGMSFNTTLGDWGIQGDFTWRSNQPFQVDVTEQIIHAAGNQCVSYGLGDSHVLALVPLGTQGVTDILSPEQNPAGSYYTAAESALLGPGALASETPANLGKVKSCRPELSAAASSPDRPTSSADIDITPVSHIRADMYTATLGTTAIYTNSNPIVQWFGADQGIVLGELGMVYVPDAPDSRGPRGGADVEKYPTLAAVCTTGTELPLGSILNLDVVNDRSCSPDSTSWGYTLVGILDYNNFWGAWRMRLVGSLNHGVNGNTPAPISSFRENAYAAGLSVNMAYQSTWSATLSYTNYFGPILYNSNSDRDFVSFSLSYAF